MLYLGNSVRLRHLTTVLFKILQEADTEMGLDVQEVFWKNTCEGKWGESQRKAEH